MGPGMSSINAIGFLTMGVLTHFVLSCLDEATDRPDIRSRWAARSYKWGRLIKDSLELFHPSRGYNW